MKSILLKCFGIVHEGHGPGLPGMLKACSLALSRPSVSTSVPSWSAAVSQGRAKSHLQLHKETPVVKRSPVQTILFLKLKWNAQCDINIELHSEVIMPAKAAQAHFSSKTIDCTSIWYIFIFDFTITSTTKPTNKLLNFFRLWTNLKSFLNLVII